MHLSKAIKFSLIFSLLTSTRAAPLTGKQDLEIELATEVPDSSFTTISILEDLTAVNPSASTEIPLLISPSESHASIISQHQEMNEKGDFSYSYNTSNGIQVGVIGTQKQIQGPDGQETKGTVSSGSYSYFFRDNGKTKRMNVVWTADERGFLPVVTISDA